MSLVKSNKHLSTTQQRTTAVELDARLLYF